MEIEWWSCRLVELSTRRVVEWWSFIMVELIDFFSYFDFNIWNSTISLHIYLCFLNTFFSMCMHRKPLKAWTARPHRSGIFVNTISWPSAKRKWGGGKLTGVLKSRRMFFRRMPFRRISIRRMSFRRTVFRRMSSHQISIRLLTVISPNVNSPNGISPNVISLNVKSSNLISRTYCHFAECQLTEYHFVERHFAEY